MLLQLAVLGLLLQSPTVLLGDDTGGGPLIYGSEKHSSAAQAQALAYVSQLLARLAVTTSATLNCAKKAECAEAGSVVSVVSARIRISSKSSSRAS
jgi:hypothetical protein